MRIITLDELTIDPEIQLRARGVSSETVQAYVEALSSGARFPPVTAFSENGTLWLADGFHRLAAWRFCGNEEIEADIRDGTRTDALVYAATANAQHGKPMKASEKREAGRRLIELREAGDLDATKWTDAIIASQIGASRQAVGVWVGEFLKEQSSKGQNGHSDDEDDIKWPRLIVARAESLPQIEDGCIDLIITSPPYNLGAESWPMGGNGRIPRDSGIDYKHHSDGLPDVAYHDWQIAVFQEMYRVARPGASFFYNHKPRNRDGELIHPMAWVGDSRNPWILRQEIVWDRGSTHNHSASLFWPEDERIYWMTKGRPILPDHSIGMSTVWRFHGPVAHTWHPAPFAEELPARCMDAVGRDGIAILDPFAGSCTTLKVAFQRGYESVGVDTSIEYLERARLENRWMKASES